MFDSKAWYYFEAGKTVPLPTGGRGGATWGFKRYYSRGPMYMTAADAEAERIATPHTSRAYRYGPYGWEQVSYIA